MRKPNAASHAAQRAHLIQAARRCFARAGFDGCSTESVRVEAKTSTGKLFHYFPNKQALILAVVEAHTRSTHSSLSALEHHDDARAALRLLLKGVIEAATDPEERCLILEISAAASRDEEIAKLSAQADKVLVQTLSALIARVKTGFLLPDEQMVALLSSWIDGVFSRAGSDPSFNPQTMLATMDNLLEVLQGTHRGSGDV